MGKERRPTRLEGLERFPRLMREQSLLLELMPRFVQTNENGFSLRDLKGIVDLHNHMATDPSRPFVQATSFEQKVSYKPPTPENKFITTISIPMSNSLIWNIETQKRSFRGIAGDWLRNESLVDMSNPHDPKTYFAASVGNHSVDVNISSFRETDPEGYVHQERHRLEYPLEKIISSRNYYKEARTKDEKSSPLSRKFIDIKPKTWTVRNEWLQSDELNWPVRVIAVQEQVLPKSNRKTIVFESTFDGYPDHTAAQITVFENLPGSDLSPWEKLVEFQEPEKVPVQVEYDPEEKKLEIFADFVAGLWISELEHDSIDSDIDEGNYYESSDLFSKKSLAETIYNNLALEQNRKAFFDGQQLVHVYLETIANLGKFDFKGILSPEAKGFLADPKFDISGNAWQIEYSNSAGYTRFKVFMSMLGCEFEYIPQKGEPIHFSVNPFA